MGSHPGPSFCTLSVNVDAELVKKSGAKLSQVEEKMVEMSNGCICCTLREDLLVEITKLAQEGRFDYLIIESTGISEPMQVAETFTFEIPGAKALAEVASLDTLVTVVDLLNFDEYFASEEDLPDRFQNVPEEDDCTVVHLLMDQVSSCLSCGCATLSASTHHSGPADRVRQCDPPQQDG